jgi:hypothetical protein
MSARVRPTRAQWAKTDEQVALRLAALDVQLEHLKPPSLADIDMHLAAHPLPDDGYVRTIDRDRWTIWMRLSGQCRARRARLCKQQAQLEHVRSCRALEALNDASASVRNETSEQEVELSRPCSMRSQPDPQATPRRPPHCELRGSPPNGSRAPSRGRKTPRRPIRRGLAHRRRSEHFGRGTQIKGGLAGDPGGHATAPTARNLWEGERAEGADGDVGNDRAEAIYTAP